MEREKTYGVIVITCREREEQNDRLLAASKLFRQSLSSVSVESPTRICGKAHRNLFTTFGLSISSFKNTRLSSTVRPE